MRARRERRYSGMGPGLPSPSELSPSLYAVLEICLKYLLDKPGRVHALRITCVPVSMRLSTYNVKPHPDFRVAQRGSNILSIMHVHIRVHSLL